MKFDLEHHPRERLTAAGFLILLAVFFAFFVSDFTTLKDEALLRYQNASAAAVAAGGPGGEGLTLARRLELAVDSVEQTVNEKIRYRENFIELHGLTQKLMAKDVVYDYNYGSIYKTSYGQITSTVNRAEVEADLEGIRQLKTELDALGLDLLYIQAPFKLPEHEQQLPPHVKEYANDNANRFLSGLEASGINYYDLRPEFFSSGMPQNQLFYDTDHHWTIEAALYSTGLIAGHLNDDYGFEIDPELTDPGRYDFKKYEDFFLGAMGRRVGKLYSGLDGFTVVTPKFETDYTVTEKDVDPAVILEGSFEEAVLVDHYLDPLAPVDTNRYAAYHGDHAELILTNHLEEKGRILMVKDSFGLPVYSFLSLGVHEIRALDVRLYKGSVAEYAKNYQPDLVIILYNPNSLAASMFEFSGN